MNTDEAVAALSDDPPTAGIFTDFDGSLSDIVDRPEAATPVDGAVEVLERAARRFALVAIVSGRSLDDLRSRFAPKGVLLAGSYGRERADLRVGRRRTEGWETVAAAAVAATRELDGVVVERKGAGVAIHYRLAPERETEVGAVAETLATEFELELRPGRLVVELVVPGPGKGDAIATLVRERALQTVLFAGDDVADLEAFRIVRGLGVRSVLVGVLSAEAPDALGAEADLVVEGPTQLVAFLGRLADA